MSRASRCVGALWLALHVAAAPTALAADGADVSYPECGRATPVGQAFGIVGVNGGRPGDANPCLSSELTWAVGSPGFEFAFGPRISLYVNTANPGPGTRRHSIAGWPHSGNSPYGACSGAATRACAYLYGEQHAEHAFALAAAAHELIASAGTWWLDVETANSWAKRGRRHFGEFNTAAIKGFVDGLRSAGMLGTVGIYSTAGDWMAITGMSSATSRSYFPTQPDWIGGAANRRQALRNCRVSFSGERALLAQYVDGGFDIDVRCL